MTRTLRRILPIFFLLTACVPEDQRTDTVDAEAGERVRGELGPEVVAQLDAGSAAFREGAYEKALEHYGKAVELDEEAAAAWFGVYMAHDALGNSEEAAKALERAQQIAPGASILRGNDGGGSR